MAEAVLNQGLPAAVDIQLTGSHLDRDFDAATAIAAKVRKLPGVSDVFIPQDINNPALQIDVDRLRAGQLGLSQREVVANVITALTSNGMIAPSYWIDPRTGNDYMLTVQYPERKVQSLQELGTIPLRATGAGRTTSLDAMTKVSRIESPTEVDHYQIQKLIDVYVSPVGEDLGQIAAGVEQVVHDTKLPEGVRVNVRGMVQSMNSAFKSFGIGLALSMILLYLILVAQFQSFIDPLLILLAVPMGLAGVLVTLPATGTTLNVAIADGHHHDGGHRGFEQHFDRRVCASTTRAWDVGERGSDHLVPGSLASHSDDVAGDDHWIDPDGGEARHRKRSIRSARARDHRRIDRQRRANGIYRSGRVFIDLRET